MKSVRITKEPAADTPDAAATPEEQQVAAIESEPAVAASKVPVAEAATADVVGEPDLADPADLTVPAEVTDPVEPPPIPRPSSDRPRIEVARADDEAIAPGAAPEAPVQPMEAPGAEQPGGGAEAGTDTAVPEEPGPAAGGPDDPIGNIIDGQGVTDKPDVPDTPTGGCVEFAQLKDRDGDFGRGKALLGKLCVEQHEFKENGANWIVHVIKRTDGKSGPLWVVPHDDENAAFDTGLSSVAQYGGAMVTVETGGKRNNGSIDPNRIFTGDAKMCKRYSPQYTKLFLDNWNSGYPIIGLHTNGLKTAKTGGEGTISIKAPPGGADAFPAPSPFVGAKSNEDTLVFVASLQPKGEDPAVDKMVEKLTGSGMNVIREHVTKSRNDCSLSNYAALNGLQKYFNIEVVHGDAATQRKMVQLIMTMR